MISDWMLDEEKGETSETHPWKISLDELTAQTDKVSSPFKIFNNFSSDIYIPDKSSHSPEGTSPGTFESIFSHRDVSAALYSIR